MQSTPNKETLQVLASASKLQQLPWTTVFESLWKLLGNRQGTRTSEKELSISSTFNISIPLECISTSWIIIDHFVHIYVCLSICHPRLCHAIRPKQWGIASAGQCKQASAAAVDNCFWRSSTCSTFRCRSWSDSLMFESVWEVFRNHHKHGHQRKSYAYLAPHSAYLQYSTVYPLSVATNHGPMCATSMSLWICHPHLCRAIRPKQRDIASAGHCKQASAAAVDNCFRRSSTCSAFRCRSWSDSLMFQSVWELLRNHHKHGHQRKCQAYLAHSAYLQYSTVYPLSVATNHGPMCATSMSLWICHPHLCHAIRRKQRDIASAGQCKQASAAAVDNCFWRSSTCSTFRCRSWSDSLMFETAWEVVRNHHKHGHQRKSYAYLAPHSAYLQYSTVYPLSVATNHGPMCATSMSLWICHPHLCRAIRPKQWDIASAGQCKQASAAAVDNCFRRSSTCSAFRCRSWSDSLMFESVWEVFRNHHKHGHQRKSYAYLAHSADLQYSAVYPLSVATNHGPLCATSMSLYLPSSSLSCNPPQTKRHVLASASKLQQLPWTTVFEDLQLVLRSAAAPDLTP